MDINIKKEISQKDIKSSSKLIDVLAGRKFHKIEIVFVKNPPCLSTLKLVEMVIHKFDIGLAFRIISTKEIPIFKLDFLNYGSIRSMARIIHWTGSLQFMESVFVRMKKKASTGKH